MRMNKRILHMNENLIRQLKFLRLTPVASQLDAYLKMANEKRLSHGQWLAIIVDDLYRQRCENAIRTRIKRANIPEVLVMETYPFNRQPRLNRAKIMAMYDSQEFLREKRNIIWLGPPGCGKTGLATSFLVRAIEQGYTGCFVSFNDLLGKLYRSLADHSLERAMRPYLKYDCLLIDEMGYMEVESEQINLLFDLLNKRHRKKSTLLTSNLGFQEWGTFLKNPYLTAALLDRLTERSDVVNMKDCISLRAEKRSKASSGKP